jgi:hypothetical protein
MAVNFETKTPKKLLATFKQAIDKGHVVTWAYDSDGDFYHTPPQWKDVGWLRPTIYEGQMLTLNFIARPSTKTTKVNYSIYHGRFIESMLAHCDELFSKATASALPTNSDSITAAA